MNFFFFKEIKKITWGAAEYLRAALASSNTRQTGLVLSYCGRTVKIDTQSCFKKGLHERSNSYTSIYKFKHGITFSWDFAYPCAFLPTFPPLTTSPHLSAAPLLKLHSAETSFAMHLLTLAPQTKHAMETESSLTVEGERCWSREWMWWNCSCSGELTCSDVGWGKQQTRGDLLWMISDRKNWKWCVLKR